MNLNGELLVGATVAPFIRSYVPTGSNGLVVNKGPGTIDFSLASIPNSAIANPFVNIIAGTGLTGGGAAALGGSVTLNASGGSGTVTNVSGTANQVAVATGTTTPVISLIGPYTPATYTAHGVLIGEGTSSITALAAGTAGQVLTSGGGSADPLYTTNFKITSDVLTNTSQPAFLAYINSSTLNVTGDSTNYIIGSSGAFTKEFDQGTNFNTNGTFTAPVTGKYFLQGSIYLDGATNLTGLNQFINTTNRTYRQDFVRPTTTTVLVSSINIIVLTDMTAADTATISVLAVDSGGKVDDVQGVSGATFTWFSGFLLC